MSCADACDNNSDSALDIANAISMLSFLFASRSLPMFISCP
jgi:hypothetical protein